MNPTVLFIISCLASFGAGWSTGVLSDLSAEKAIATGIATLCTYILGSQQKTTDVLRK